MARLAAILVAAIGLSACNLASTLVNGLKYADAVATDVETATGVKPKVGFNWVNGRLVTVTVAFPRIYDAKPLGELAATVRHAVVTEFKQTPENIELMFALGNAEGPAAQRNAPAAVQRSALVTPPPRASPDRSLPRAPRRI